MSEEPKKQEHQIIDPKQFAVGSSGVIEGDFIDFRTSTPKQIIDWMLDGTENVTPTDIVRNWMFASIPCKICGKKPEEIVAPGEAMYVVSFMCTAPNPKRREKYGAKAECAGIRFFCRDHAQILQDEIISRGLEIITEEQKRELLSKLEYNFAEEQ